VAHYVAHVLYSSALTVIAVVCNLQKPDASQAALAVFMAAAVYYVCDFAAALQSIFVCSSTSAFVSEVSDVYASEYKPDLGYSA